MDWRATHCHAVTLFWTCHCHRAGVHRHPVDCSVCVFPRTADKKGATSDEPEAEARIPSLKIPVITRELKPVMNWL
jgi:hypothetical protein